MGADALAHVLRPLASAFGASVPDLLVGLDAADDAAVYRLNDEQAIVVTTDFFPPVVDDPYTFGAVAAANALSDVYAMGGSPLICLNLVAFPDDLDTAILSEILRGGAEKVREAGAVIAGGHTVTDREPKYGLAAIGIVHPQRILSKSGARPGDILVLTKPIGTGVITTALKAEAAEAGDIASAIACMTQLNGPALGALRTLDADLHACTDVTGFGLLGHGLELAQRSAVKLTLQVDAIPILPGASRYTGAGHIPGGTQRNAEHVAPHVTYGADVTATDRLLLADPQTSGGLLAAVAATAIGRAREALAAAGVVAAVIGEVTDGSGILVT